MPIERQQSAPNPSQIVQGASDTRQGGLRIPVTGGEVVKVSPQITHVDAPVARAPFLRPIDTVDGGGVRRGNVIEGAIFTPLATPDMSMRLSYDLSSGEQPELVYTAGGTAGKNPRKLARSAIKGYGERYMGGEQHIVHVVQDMIKRPGRALAQGIITGLEFGAMLASKVVRDAIEEAGFGTIVEGLILGRRLTIGRNPDTGNIGIYFRKMGIVERLAVIFELGPVYDAGQLIIQLAKDVVFGIGQLFTIGKALREGPKHGYSMEEGRASGGDNPQTPMIV